MALTCTLVALGHVIVALDASGLQLVMESYLQLGESGSDKTVHLVHNATFSSSVSHNGHLMHGYN